MYIKINASEYVYVWRSKGYTYLVEWNLIIFKKQIAANPNYTPSEFRSSNPYQQATHELHSHN